MQQPVKLSPPGTGGSIPSRPTGNSRQQGAIGVGRAIAYYSSRGYAVFVTISDVSRFDFVVDTGERLLRVEVKTTRQASGLIDLRTHGGNRSWSGVVKRLSETDCDIVFVVNVATGSEREYPVSALEGMSTITVR